MPHRFAILDDYQNVALHMADWSPIRGEVDIKVFHEPLGDLDNVTGVLGGCAIVCLMRERTPFPRRAFEALAPHLKLLITTGARNASIDLAAAKDHDVVV
jgi:hypothetical protein